MCSCTATSVASRRRLAWSPGLEAGPLDPWCGTAAGLQEAAATGKREESGYEPATATGKRVSDKNRILRS
jgi:hypothetical protein